MKGYDSNPAYSKYGVLDWLSMSADGYESDKNDIMILDKSDIKNLTENWDGIVSSFKWSTNGKKIYFVAQIDDEKHLFVANYSDKARNTVAIRQITKGQFDMTGILDQSGNKMIVSRTDMNRDSELHTINLEDSSMKQLPHVSDKVYATITLMQNIKKVGDYHRQQANGDLGLAQLRFEQKIPHFVVLPVRTSGSTVSVLFLQMEFPTDGC